MFFRLINDLNQICNGNVIEEIKAFSDDKEINITNKVNVISDFFNNFQKRFHQFWIQFSIYIVAFLCCHCVFDQLN